MGKNWTDDQLSAINSIDKGTIVSAAAGSGKTAVLVERTIRMLSDESLGIEADRLLAATFTNDAANQMKDKLSAAMSAQLEQNPENLWISKQQELLSMASICTIDSFCMELVKNNINEFEISGNFVTLEEEEHRILIQKAFEEAAEYYYKNKPDEMKILMDNFAEEDDKEVIRYAQELLKFKGSLPFPKQWKRKALLNFENIIDEHNNKQAERIPVLVKNLLDCAKALKAESEKVGSEKKYEKIFCAYENLVEQFSKEDLDFGRFILGEEFLQIQKMRYPSKPKASSLDYDAALIYEKIGKIKDNSKKILEQLSQVEILSKEDMADEISETKRIFEALWGFVDKAEEILWEYKLEKNKLHFSDITKLTIKLLAKETEDGFERTELSKKIRAEKRYKIILIDEFQDVNNLQDVIFKCISDTDDMNVLGKNVFVVGDMKQSIYRFRQSNPKIFDKARQTAALEQNNDKAAAVYLKKNFRSRKNVLDFTNFIFENVMSRELGEVLYDENERLELGADYSGENFETKILLLDKSSEAHGDEDGEEENDEDSVNFECKAVALEIKRMIEQKIPVQDEDGTRPCRGGDFCVLLRTGKLVSDYIKAFELVNIKAVSDSVKGYLGAREVSLALSMLKIVDNPMQDIPFSAVCLSPVFGFTPDELSQIRLVDRRKKLYQLFLAISRDERVREYGFEPVDINNEALAKKCADAVAVISKLRFYSAGMSLEKLVRKVYDVTDFMAAAAAFENSQQKRANLRMLVKFAADYEASSGGGLSDFLRYLDRVSQSGNDFDEALTVAAGKDTVYIKTIHKSKGLEYPFVVVGDMAREYNIPKKGAKLFLNEAVGVGMTLSNNLPKCNSQTVFYNYVFDSNVLEQKSEELRILYVALTRAKEKLILPLYLKSNGLRRIKKAADELSVSKRLTPEIVSGFSSYGEIIAGALLSHPQRQEVCDFFGVEISPDVRICGSADLEFERITFCENDTDKKQEFVKAPVDRNLFDKIIRNLSFKEDYSGTETVAKLSVTEFVREIEEGRAEKEITYFPPVPDVSKEDRKATAAEKGTDTHLFMELCDFQRAQAGVENELERLVSLNRMTRRQAENVDVKTVRAFFESEIYELCKNAREVMREKKFLVRLSDLDLDKTPLEQYNDKDVMVQGIADMIIQTEEGCIIVDYKTDNVSRPEELIERHWIQLFLYKKAFELVLDTKVKDCYIYSFKLKKPVKIDFENLHIFHKKA